MNRVKTARIGSLTFQPGNLDSIIENYIRLNPSSGIPIHLVNAYSVVLSRFQSDYKKVLQNDVLICDGKPLYIYLKSQNFSITYNRGADLMRRYFANESKSSRHFLLGGTNETLELLCRKMLDDHPNLVICGTFSPKFGDFTTEDIRAIARRIEKKKPNIIWVGLGTPKQDYFVHELSKFTESQIIGVGAAFDFLSALKKEAPKYFRTLGIEWLFRLFSEPKRLWKRYLIGNVLFIIIVIEDIVKRILHFSNTRDF